MGPIEETLRKAKALIDTPEKWTQGFFAKDIKGRHVLISDEKATSFCSIGAIAVASGKSGIAATLGPITGFFERIVSNNSHPSPLADFNDTHTHPEVMAAWDKAIALAAEEGV